MRTQDNTTVQKTQEENLEREIKRKWTPQRIGAERTAASFQRLDMMRRAERVGGCGTWLEFAITPDSAKLHHANFCRDRMCPMCNERRSLKIFAQASKIMDWLDSHNKYRYLFLTLTVRNCDGDELAGYLDEIFAGWKRLTQRDKRWKAAIAGSMRTLEITRNPNNGTWHPHFHCILAVQPSYFNTKRGLYITQDGWAEMWRHAVRADYKPVVDIRTVKANNRPGIINELSGRDNKKSRSARDGKDGAAKYASKAVDYLGPEPIIDEYGECLNVGELLPDSEVDTRVRTLADALAGRRLVGWTGCFREARRALELDDAESGDLIHTDPDELRSDVAMQLITYQWRCGVYTRDS